MEVPFTNLYGIMGNPSIPQKTTGPGHTDARAFESALAEARGEQDASPAQKSNPAAQMAFSKMGAGVVSPLPHKVDSQRQVDTARTALYEQVLTSKGISHNMVKQLAAAGGSQAMLNLRGVIPEGTIDAQGATLHRKN